LDMHVSRARAIEFAQIDALPGSLDESAVADRYHGGKSHEGGFNMRRGVALGVLIGPLPRNHSFERRHDVGANIRVGVLVDGDASGRMWNIDQAGAFFDAHFGDDRGDLTGDFLEVGPRRRSNTQYLHARQLCLSSGDRAHRRQKIYRNRDTFTSDGVWQECSKTVTVYR